MIKYILFLFGLTFLFSSSVSFAGWTQSHMSPHMFLNTEKESKIKRISFFNNKPIGVRFELEFNKKSDASDFKLICESQNIHVKKEKDTNTIFFHFTEDNRAALELLLNEANRFEPIEPSSVLKKISMLMDPLIKVFPSKRVHESIPQHSQDKIQVLHETTHLVKKESDRPPQSYRFAHVPSLPANERYDEARNLLNFFDTATSTVQLSLTQVPTRCDDQIHKRKFDSSPSGQCDKIDEDAQIIHLGQRHWRPEYKDNLVEIENVSRSQFEIAQLILSHSDYEVFEEGLSVDLKDQFSYDPDHHMMAKATSHIFPDGLPDQYNKLTSLQREYLAQRGAPEVLWHLGKIKSRHKTITPDEEARIGAILNPLIEEGKLEFSAENLDLLFTQRDHALQKEVNSYLELNPEKKVIICFGLAHNVVWHFKNRRFQKVDCSGGKNSMIDGSPYGSVSGSHTITIQNSMNNAARRGATLHSRPDGNIGHTIFGDAPNRQGRGPRDNSQGPFRLFMDL